MENERVCQIFNEYGSMKVSWGDLIDEETLKDFFQDNVLDGTNCSFGELQDKTLERFGVIVEAFITYAGIDANDGRQLAQMALLYELLWDDVLGCWNDDTDIVRIEYNDEILVNKPTNEVFEEYKSYLEKIEGNVPSYEREDEEWDDEDWDDEDNE